MILRSYEGKICGGGKKNIGNRGRFANTLYMGKISSNLLYLHHGDEGVLALGQGKRDKKGLDQNAVFYYPKNNGDAILSFHPSVEVLVLKGGLISLGEHDSGGAG